MLHLFYVTRDKAVSLSPKTFYEFQKNKSIISFCPSVTLSHPALILPLGPCSNRVMCGSGGLQPSGERGAPTQPRGCGRDPGAAAPRPGHVHRNTRLHRMCWLRTQGSRQATEHHTTVSCFVGCCHGVSVILAHAVPSDSMG